MPDSKHDMVPGNSVRVQCSSVEESLNTVKYVKYSFSFSNTDVFYAFGARNMIRSCWKMRFDAKYICNQQ